MNFDRSGFFIVLGIGITFGFVIGGIVFIYINDHAVKTETFKTKSIGMSEITLNDTDSAFAFAENELKYYSENKTEIFVSEVNQTKQFFSEESPDSPLVIIKTTDGKEYPIEYYKFPLKIPYGKDLLINVKTTKIECGKGITIQNQGHATTFFPDVMWSRNGTEIKSQLPKIYENFTFNRGIEWAEIACDSNQVYAKIFLDGIFVPVKFGYSVWSISDGRHGVTFND